jgi:hypothetical protein
MFILAVTLLLLPTEVFINTLVQYGVTHGVLFALPASTTEQLTPQNIKIALECLGLLASLPESLKQSMQQSLGLQALQYSFWWHRQGKVQWAVWQPRCIRLLQWVKQLRQQGIVMPQRLVVAFSK